jgi:hypothetical protein
LWHRHKASGLCDSLIEKEKSRTIPRNRPLVRCRASIKAAVCGLLPDWRFCRSVVAQRNVRCADVVVLLTAVLVIVVFVSYL